MASTKPAAKITIRFNEPTDAGMLLPKRMYGKNYFEKNDLLCRVFHHGLLEDGYGCNICRSVSKTKPAEKRRSKLSLLADCLQRRPGFDLFIPLPIKVKAIYLLPQTRIIPYEPIPLSLAMVPQFFG
jgi:hypothetical protein